MRATNGKPTPSSWRTMTPTIVLMTKEAFDESLILLDLNMPRKYGREALKEIKADPSLENIRVVILSTSKAEEDIYRTYDLSTASFITKPVTFAGMAEVIKAIGKYWLEIVELPAERYGTGNG